MAVAAARGVVAAAAFELDHRIARHRETQRRRGPRLAVAHQVVTAAVGERAIALVGCAVGGERQAGPIGLGAAGRQQVHRDAVVVAGRRVLGAAPVGVQRPRGADRCDPGVAAAVCREARAVVDARVEHRAGGKGGATAQHRRAGWRRRRRCRRRGRWWSGRWGGGGEGWGPGGGGGEGGEGDGVGVGVGAGADTPPLELSPASDPPPQAVASNAAVNINAVMRRVWGLGGHARTRCRRRADAANQVVSDGCR